MDLTRDFKVCLCLSEVWLSGADTEKRLAKKEPYGTGGRGWGKQGGGTLAQCSARGAEAQLTLLSSHGAGRPHAHTCRARIADTQGTQPTRPSSSALSRCQLMAVLEGSCRGQVSEGHKVQSEGSGHSGGMLPPAHLLG